MILKSEVIQTDAQRLEKRFDFYILQVLKKI